MIEQSLLCGVAFGEQFRLQGCRGGANTFCITFLLCVVCSSKSIVGSLFQCVNRQDSRTFSDVERLVVALASVCNHSSKIRTGLSCMQLQFQLLFFYSNPQSGRL